MFAATPSGAHASAAIYSMISTAKANGLEPYAYLRHVIVRLPAVIGVADVEALLPWNLSPEMLNPRLRLTDGALRDAVLGLLTKHGRPAILAVPSRAWANDSRRGAFESRRVSNGKMHLEAPAKQ